jgi:sugar-phosphatase
MQNLKCHAILFDMDGVLVDSTACVERHWYAWAERHGLDFAQIMAISHGQRAIDTMKAVASALGLDLEREALVFEQGQARDLEGILAMPGALELVTALAPECWAIVTSATLPMASARLEAIGLPRPRVFVTAEEVRQGKPHPEGYLKAASLLGVTPRDCLVIEDAPAGIQAAHDGDIRVLAVATTFPAEKLQAADFVTAGLHMVHLSASHALKQRWPWLHLRVDS